MTWLLWLGSGACLVALAAAGLTALGARRWAGAMASLSHRLDAARIADRDGASAWPTRYDARELRGLPAPVQRYFHAVLQDGQPIITAVTIDTTGRFNLSATGAQWKPFTARQRVVMRRPGFVWDARIALAPGLTVRVVDSCIAGQGLLRASIQGVFNLAEVHGDGEIARGEFMRWFAEAAWYPTALLPSQGVRWEAVDDQSANATVVDGPLSLTLLFRFNAAGLITGFRADARGGLVGQSMVMAPWEGNWSNHQVRGGMQLPHTGEVAWMRPDGRRPYFIGTVTAMVFEHAGSVAMQHGRG
jgi:hypothetical protein